MTPKLYATPTGKRYHRTDLCEGLNSWHTAMCSNVPVPTITRAEAARRRLTPCRTCQPVPLLGVVR